MSPLDNLIAEYENKLTFEFINMPNKLHGLIDGDVVYINKNSSIQEQYSALAEELGHYETSADDDIADYSIIKNMKQEVRARRWSYEKLVPVEDLRDIISSNNQIEMYELAEIFHVPQKILECAIEYYKIREMF